MPGPDREPPTPPIKIRGLGHSFGAGETRRPVLSDLSLDVHPGQIVALTGPSGSGKTTLLTLVGALRSVEEGSLLVLGTELAGLPKGEMVALRRQLGFIFQHHNLFESLTALRNVTIALELHCRGPALEERAREMLEAVGLAEHLNSKPATLSGGQRQRVAIARALAPRPRLILADEPTAALDEPLARSVIRLLQRLAKETATTVLLVTHDPRILDATDRIVSLVDGRIASDVEIESSVEIYDFLQKVHLFSQLPPATLARVAKRIRTESFAEGDTIIRRGDPGDNFYILRSGWVRVITRSEDTEEVKNTLGPGSYFGEIALMEGISRTASVVAAETVEVFVLDEETFKSAVTTSRSFEQELRRVMSTRR